MGHIKQNACWYTLITKKTVRISQGLLKVAHVGHYLIRECVDLFDEGGIVTKQDIERQLAIFHTENIRSGFANEEQYQTWRQGILSSGVA